MSRAGVVEIAEDGPRWDAALRHAGEDRAGRDVRARRGQARPGAARLRQPRRAARGGLRPHRRSQGGEARRAQVALPRPRGARRRHPVRPVPRRRSSTGPTAAADRPCTSGWSRASASSSRCPPGSAEAAAYGERLRAEIYAIVRNTDPGPRVPRAAAGGDGAGRSAPKWNGGVFVRSDTNVEDLPGFTGAGLNLTLFNVVGFDNVVKAISEVWASPYTPARLGVAPVAHEGAGARLPGRAAAAHRAFGHLGRDDHAGRRHGRPGRALGGRQRRRRRRGRRPGGRVGAHRHARPARALLMAAATAPRRMVPLPTGGIAKRPVSGAETRCSRRPRSKQLIAFADEIPRKFPQLGEDGKPVAADVEFAFVDGRLWLLQIRPFNESRQARGSSVPDRDGQGRSNANLRARRRHAGGRQVSAGQSFCAALPRRGARPRGRCGRRLSARRLRVHRHPPARGHPPRHTKAWFATSSSRRARCWASRTSTCACSAQTFDLPAARPGVHRAGRRHPRRRHGRLRPRPCSTSPTRPSRATPSTARDYRQNVGSVGKLVVALALFQALADPYPDDLGGARARAEEHDGDGRRLLAVRPPHGAHSSTPRRAPSCGAPCASATGASLYEWLDWMLSPSSNSAAGMVMREAMLLRQFGKAYPLAEAEIQRFFGETPKAELTALFDADLHRAGDAQRPRLEHAAPGQLLHRTSGKRDRAGPGESYGTARELMRYLLRDGAGAARRRVLQPRDQAADLRHRDPHPLRLVAGARAARPSTSSRDRSTSARRKPASPASPTPATSRTT